MAIHKALLIQDVSDLVKLIAPCLERAFEAFMYDYVEPMSALQWILEKEIELIYGLVSKDHDRFHEPNSRIYDYLNELYPEGLSSVVAAHVGVPYADLDHTVELEVGIYDLRIRYVPLYKSVLQLPYHFKQLSHHVPYKTAETLFGPARNS